MQIQHAQFTSWPFAILLSSVSACAAQDAPEFSQGLSRFSAHATGIAVR